MQGRKSNHRGTERLKLSARPCSLRRNRVWTRLACGQLMGGFAASRVLEVHGQKMIQRTFDPGFRIDLHQKDLNLALADAKTLNMGCRTPRQRNNCSVPVLRMGAAAGIIPR